MSSAGMTAVSTRYFLFFPEKLSGVAGVESWLGGVPLGGQYAMLGR